MQQMRKLSKGDLHKQSQDNVRIRCCRVPVVTDRHEAYCLLNDPTVPSARSNGQGNRERAVVFLLKAFAVVCGLFGEMHQLMGECACISTSAARTQNWHDSLYSVEPIKQALAVVYGLFDETRQLCVHQSHSSTYPKLARFSL